jgi:hypothetical protein
MHCSANIDNAGPDQRRAVLRAQRHGQDHAVGRPRPLAHRRRRARLGAQRRVQLRGRVLREVHQALARRVSPRSGTRSGSAACSRTPSWTRRHRDPDYDDGSITENTRVTYPVDFIPGATIPSVGGHPKNVIFLTADAYGVLPPVAADARAGDVLLHQRVHVQARGDRGGRDRAGAQLQPLLRRAVPAPPPQRVRRDARGADQEVQGERLAAQHGLDGRRLRRGAPHEPGLHPRDGHRHPRRHAAREDFDTDPFFGLAVPRHASGACRRACCTRPDAWKDKAAYEAQAHKAEPAEKFRENDAEVPDQRREVLVAAGPKADTCRSSTASRSAASTSPSRSRSPRRSAG